MTVDFSSFTESDDRDEFLSKVIEYLLETVENDVSLSRFNEPKNGETIEPNVENVINLTVRNRGSEDQDNIVVSIDIDCKNSTYTFDDQTTISLDSKEMAFVEFEWDTPEDEDYEYDITAEAYISNDEKEDNDIKEITVNTNVIYDLELSLARVDPTFGQ